VLPSHTPGWDWWNWEVSAAQAPGAGVTAHPLGTRGGGTPWPPHGCSPDELRQLPGLHQAVGQVGVLLPAVLGVQLARAGGKAAVTPPTSICPAPGLPANPPSPSRRSLWGSGCPLLLHPTPLGSVWDAHPAAQPGCGSVPPPLSPPLEQYFIKSVHGPARVSAEQWLKQGDSKGGVRPLLPLHPIITHPVLGPSPGCSRG